MKTKLKDVVLKDGATMAVELVLAPEPDLSEDLVLRLAHKGEPWVAHLRLIVEGKTDALETRFYIGRQDGAIIGNICTFEYRGHGVLGHVYTDPNHRRRGICSRLMEVLMDDARRRGVQVLTLGTGYDSAAYHIYRDFGFASLKEKSGCMRWLADANFEARTYVHAPAAWATPTWSDWPGTSTLFSLSDGAWIRNLHHHRLGPSHFEGGFIADQMRVKAAVARHVLRTTDGVIVGYAALYPEERWEDQAYLFDCFVAPLFRRHVGELQPLVPWPNAKVQCYVLARDREAREALEGLGFAAEATFRRHAPVHGNREDVIVMALEA